MNKKELIKNIKKELIPYKDDAELDEYILFAVMKHALGDDNLSKIFSIAVVNAQWDDFFKKYGWTK